MLTPSQAAWQPKSTKKQPCIFAASGYHLPLMIRRIDFGSETEAREAMTRTGVDPRGVEIMARKFLYVTFVATGLRPAACNILKQEMLAAGGEAAVARGTVNCSVESSDAIVGGTVKQMEILVAKLEGQPFGLSELAAGIKTQLAGTVPPPIEWAGGRLDFSGPPLLMGILNITPDSFSDGGKNFDAGRAVENGVAMAEAGAALIDVGGESTRPGSEPVSEDGEKRRVIPVIEDLARRVKVPISIDTYRAGTARAALDAGASIINDVTGLRSDNAMAGLAAERKAPVVVMHMRGTPKTMQAGRIEYADLVGEISSVLMESVEKAVTAGLPRHFVIIDPGIGFGKTAAHNFEIVARLPELGSLGQPVLVGPSQKAFIGAVTGKAAGERGWGTAAVVSACVSNGAHVIRVHDVAAMREVAAVAAAVRDK
ncbi:MAG: dihydropteroate synthase [Deltaproteobacteria bacterium]|nr:dihydropteroate synthase [Deltaproteobacteria bacterium]